MIFISLATCSIAPLIDQVLDSLFENTTLPFTLSIFDNYSLDNTVEKINTKLVQYKDKISANKCKVHFYNSLTRTPSIDCINSSFIPYFESDDKYSMICKLDHDYCLPKNWDLVLTDLFLRYPDLQLLSPSVDPSTPKGMQYHSQGHLPEQISRLPISPISGTSSPVEIYHYTGIAGYCHCFRPSILNRLKEYRAMNVGAVFGSEDADWSLRCGNMPQKGYITSLQGFHLDKPDIGTLEGKWKGEATFLKTFITLEEYLKANLSEEEYDKQGFNT